MRYNTLLLLTLLISTCYLLGQAQNKIRAYNPDGTMYRVDTASVRSVKQYYESTGNKFLAVDELSDINKTSIMYQPLSYVPVLVFAKDSVAAVNALKSLNKQKYQNSWSFKSDFDRMVDLLFTKDEVIKILGKPNDEYEKDEVYTILVYEGFSLQFIKSVYPEHTYLDKLIRYNLTGAKKSGIGISDFHINLSDLDNDYVTGFRGTFLNMGSKKIKYLYITVQALNGVDDLVSKKTATAIGPILPKNQGSYNYDQLFFSKIIESVKITAIKIQYFDGTFKLITGSLLTGSFVEK